MNDLTKKDILKILAEHLGVSEEDIHLEDSFVDHLHMNPVSMSDFIKVLEEKGVETDLLDLSQIKTVQDLLEGLGFEEEEEEDDKLKND